MLNLLALRDWFIVTPFANLALQGRLDFLRGQLTCMNAKR